uniref:F-box domain-containing protein n=1 Tax=Periophthalmus magnuspinnatus TaxID=409849 RepID=A0A3B4AHI6_9GOBI
MLLTELNQHCLVHLFSFLDKESRSRLSRTCLRLKKVFEEPCLWTRLQFSSPTQLRRGDFILSPSLRFLTISWFSIRVQQVCNIEDWLKSSFQKDMCSQHDGLVRDFLQRVYQIVANAFSLLNE